jgi:hypothetical protein
MFKIIGDLYSNVNFFKFFSKKLSFVQAQQIIITRQAKHSASTRQHSQKMRKVE